MYDTIECVKCCWVQALASMNVGHNTLSAAPLRRVERDVFMRCELVEMNKAFEVGDHSTKPKEIWDMLQGMAQRRNAVRLYGVNERGFKGKTSRSVSFCSDGCQWKKG